jgi:hypothetical protein
MLDNKPPYSKSFVMKTTLHHMRKSVDISVNKSFDRLKDFDNDSDTGKEIIETLSVLHTIKKMLDEFEQNNQHLFIDKSKGKV